MNQAVGEWHNASQAREWVRVLHEGLEDMLLLDNAPDLAWGKQVREVTVRTERRHGRNRHQRVQRVGSACSPEDQWEEASLLGRVRDLASHIPYERA